MPSRSAAIAILLLPLAPAASLAQPQGSVGAFSDVTIEGSVLEPSPIEISDDAELAGLITVPDGFSVEVAARDLGNARMLAVSDAGHVYVTRRDNGDVIRLNDAEGDGYFDDFSVVAERPGLHGIAFDGDTVFLVTVNDVYTAPVEADGSFGDLTRIIDDLPDGGQHPNRTLAIGPDEHLYISVGSTCNACAETNPENATILRASKDGKSRAIFASGLRNTIGFDWEPQSGNLYGVDHGTDWLGDEEQQEELNLIEQGKQYGWPYVYDFSNFNPQDNPPEGMTLEEWAQMSEEPVLGYTAHSAPMQMAFYDAAAFPAEYRGDAFVAMRGSWNRRPPSGYEIARIDFEDGEPVAFEHFAQGFLIEEEDGGYGFLGRLAGLAVAPDGSLLVTDDTNGVLYRISYDGEEGQGTEEGGSVGAQTPSTVPEPAETPLAIEQFEAEAMLEVTSSFPEGGDIPIAHSAEGHNASPELSWSGAPGEARSFVVIMSDPDAAFPKPFVHWIVYDIPGGTTALREGLPTQSVLPEPLSLKQGANSRNAVGYFGPRPPAGDPAHHYHFQVFALDVETLGLDPGANREDVLAAMEGHVIGKGEIVGLFQRPAPERPEG